MFGFFTNDKDKFGSDDEPVTIGPNLELHAWIRRAASKVTVAFNGAGLHDGVSILSLDRIHQGYSSALSTRIG